MTGERVYMRLTVVGHQKWSAKQRKGLESAIIKTIDKLRVQHGPFALVVYCVSPIDDFFNGKRKLKQEPLKELT